MADNVTPSSRDRVKQAAVLVALMLVSGCSAAKPSCLGNEPRDRHAAVQIAKDDLHQRIIQYGDSNVNLTTRDAYKVKAMFLDVDSNILERILIPKRYQVKYRMSIAVYKDGAFVYSEENQVGFCGQIVRD